jgi:YD repeat-containing protein
MTLRRIVLESGLPMTLTLFYNGDNKLTAITQTITSTVRLFRYAYNGDGRRVWAEADGQKTAFI